MASKIWTRVDVKCGAETAEILAVEFAENFGVSVEYISDGIRIYLDSKRFSGEERRLREIVESVQALQGEEVPALEISNIPDEDWSQTWKANFKPLRVGTRFLVSPTWETVDPESDRLVIRIDPGMAFGTGHHETTRLCLEWLEKNSPNSVLSSSKNRRSSLLDIGTGSGILAIGAALLGFGEVVGIDNDPEAIKVASENVELNSLTEKIRVYTANPEEMSGSFDVVISNIQSMPLIKMSGTIASRVRDAGLLALSGILVEQADEVRAEYEKRHLRLIGETRAGEWVLLSFEK